MKRVQQFTLIELLVVVAIIAILAAMLLPALNKARSVARKTQCLNHIRQVNMGLRFYADGNDDWLPQLNSTFGSYVKYYWISRLIHDRHITSGGILACPEQAFKPYGSGAYGDLFVDYVRKYQGSFGESYTLSFMSYGYNTMLSSGSGAVKLNRVKKPSETISLAENARLNLDDVRGYYGVYYKYNSTNSYGHVYPRHHQFANIGWLDGHATSERASLDPQVTYTMKPFADSAVKEGPENYWDLY
ncbi:MAG: type II secretion system protein [Victivallaceae bacterium]